MLTAQKGRAEWSRWMYASKRWQEAGTSKHRVRRFGSAEGQQSRIVCQHAQGLVAMHSTSGQASNEERVWSPGRNILILLPALTNEAMLVLATPPTLSVVSVVGYVCCWGVVSQTSWELGEWEMTTPDLLCQRATGRDDGAQRVRLALAIWLYVGVATS